MAGVTRLRKGRGGVDGVSSTTQHISGIEELGVGHGLQTQLYIRSRLFHKNLKKFAPMLHLLNLDY